MAKRLTLDTIHYEVDKLQELMDEKIYDEEGDFREDWTEGNQRRWRMIFSTVEDLKAGLYAIGLGNVKGEL